MTPGNQGESWTLGFDKLNNKIKTFHECLEKSDSGTGEFLKFFHLWHQETDPKKHRFPKSNQQIGLLQWASLDQRTSSHLTSLSGNSGQFCSNIWKHGICHYIFSFQCQMAHKLVATLQKKYPSHMLKNNQRLEVTPYCPDFTPNKQLSVVKDQALQIFNLNDKGRREERLC